MLIRPTVPDFPCVAVASEMAALSQSRPSAGGEKAVRFRASLVGTVDRSQGGSQRPGFGDFIAGEAHFFEIARAALAVLTDSARDCIGHAVGKRKRIARLLLGGDRMVAHCGLEQEETRPLHDSRQSDRIGRGRGTTADIR